MQHPISFALMLSLFLSACLLSSVVCSRLTHLRTDMLLKFNNLGPFEKLIPMTLDAAAAAYSERIARKDFMTESFQLFHCPAIKFDEEPRKIEHKRTGAGALLLHSKSENLHIISFRGTENLRNIIHDANIEKKKLNINLQHGGSKTCGRIHKGFSDTYFSIQPLLLDYIKQSLKERGNSRFVFTGHSLGGALAVLAAVDLLYELDINPKRFAIVTYGQPLFTDKNFVKCFEDSGLEDRIIRVVLKKDAIVTLSGLFGFKTPGEEDKEDVEGSITHDIIHYLTGLEVPYMKPICFSKKRYRELCYEGFDSGDTVFEDCGLPHGEGAYDLKSPLEEHTDMLMNMLEAQKLLHDIKSKMIDSLSSIQLENIEKVVGQAMNNADVALGKLELAMVSKAVGSGFIDGIERIPSIAEKIKGSSAGKEIMNLVKVNAKPDVILGAIEDAASSGADFADNTLKKLGNVMKGRDIGDMSKSVASKASSTAKKVGKSLSKLFG